MIDERTRHEMYLGLVEKLGPPVADAVMQHLPPVGWADVATKHDLAALEERIDARFTQVDNRFKTLVALMDRRFENVLDTMTRRISESEARMDALGSDLRADFAVGQRRMIQWMVATAIAIMAVAAAIASAAIQLG